MIHDAILYDIEIRNCIPKYGEDNSLSPYKFCGGWSDHIGMGISVICTYDFATQRYGVYLRDNFAEFASLVARREYVIGYNSKSFDDAVCKAHNIHVETTYDLMHEVKLASGLSPNARVKGYRLKDVAAVNLSMNKSGDGADAPILWQSRRIGELITYCLGDIQVAKAIFEKEDLVDPVSGNPIKLRTLFEAKNGGQQSRMEF